MGIRRNKMDIWMSDTLNTYVTNWFRVKDEPVLSDLVDEFINQIAKELVVAVKNRWIWLVMKYFSKTADKERGV